MQRFGGQDISPKEMPELMFLGVSNRIGQVQLEEVIQQEI